jgi:transcriptional regulator with XRE-family HTH domain
MEYSDEIKAFGREVRRRREALGLTLEELGERSGLTPNYIGGVELGKRDVSLSTALKLAEGLGASLPELIGTTALGPAALECGLLLDSSPPELREIIMIFLRYVYGLRKKK